MNTKIGGDRARVGHSTRHPPPPLHPHREIFGGKLVGILRWILERLAGVFAKHLSAAFQAELMIFHGILSLLVVSVVVPLPRPQTSKMASRLPPLEV